jgi:hypothetical protein
MERASKVSNRERGGVGYNAVWHQAFWGGGFGVCYSILSAQVEKLILLFTRTQKYNPTYLLLIFIS